MSEWPAFVDALARRTGAALADVRERLAARADALEFRPADGAWSNLEIAEHVALVDRYLLILAEKIAAKSNARARRGPPSAAEPSPIAHLESLASREFAWSSPAHMRPSGRVAPQAIASELDLQAARCAALLADARDGRGTLHRIRMSVVDGDDRLDLYQFMTVIALHAERHARQMQRNADERARRARH